MSGTVPPAERAPDTGSPWPVRLTTFVTVVLAGWPVWTAPHLRALGRRCSEAPAHLWGLWVATDGLFSHGPLLRDTAVGFPGHFRHHLIDPVHLLVFAPLMGLVDGPAGAVLAWNLVHVGWVGLGAWGTAVLARRLGFTGWSAAAWVACVAGGAAVAQHPELGRSEYLPALGLPWVLVGLWDAAHGARPLRGPAAGALLGLLTLSGPTLALFTLPWVALVGLWWTRRWRVLAAVLVPGLVGACVALAAIYAWPPQHLPDALSGAGREAVQSAELLNLVGLGPPVRDLEHTLYLGIVALLMTGLGLVGDRRRAWPWVGLAAVLVLVGLGPEPTAAGRPLVGPLSVLTQMVDVLSSVAGWPRVAWLLGIPLGACAAVGTGVVVARARWAGPLVVAALLVDARSFPGARVQGDGDPTFSPALSTELQTVLQQLPNGPLATLPATTPAAVEACPLDAPWLLRSVATDRSVTATHGNPSDGLVGTGWLADGLALRPEHVLRHHRRSPIDPSCVREEVARLQALGVVAYVVDDSLPRGRPARAALTALMGSPSVSEGTLAGWVLAEWLADAPVGDCPGVALPGARDQRGGPTPR